MIVVSLPYCMHPTQLIMAQTWKLMCQTRRTWHVAGPAKRKWPLGRKIEVGHPLWVMCCICVWPQATWVSSFIRPPPWMQVIVATHTNHNDEHYSNKTNKSQLNQLTQTRQNIWCTKTSRTCNFRTADTDKLLRLDREHIFVIEDLGKWPLRNKSAREMCQSWMNGCQYPACI